MSDVKQDREANAARPLGGLTEQIAFDPVDPKAALARMPQASAVFALYAEEAHAEPYVGRTPNLRARLERLLQPSPRHPRRLQLAGLVRRIAWRLTGSEFESLLVQFELLESIHGAKALERMHLRHPAFVRFLGGNPYPRVAVTFRPSLRQADWAYGPFPSRAAAERFVDEALKLFLLRRCTFDLAPDPSYPGCVYSEMKMCLAPCFKGCTDERYAEESAAVENFLATRGESRLQALRAQRDEASANLAFEHAAALHDQVQRVESVRALAAELVRPLSRLRAMILQPSANPGEIAVFLFEDGSLRGPVAFSTVGMRIQNEQSGSTSLFAQPMGIEPVPEEAEDRDQGSGVRDQGSENREQGMESGEQKTENRDRESRSGEQGTTEGGLLAGDAHARSSPAAVRLARGMLESRLEDTLVELRQPTNPPSTAQRQAHLALLKRWYYRPEARRTGEIFFSDAEDRWPAKAILRGIGRVAAKALAP